MKNIFNLWRCVPADILYKIADSETVKKIDADAKRYLEKYSPENINRNGLSAINYLLLTNRVFRNVFYYRVRRLKKISTLSKLILPGIKEVEIHGDIGAGLLLSPDYMVVRPQKAGKNLSVGPGTVIGKNKGNHPIIGDNVYIAANSTVIGDINIGDNVVICAGSVVTKSLPGNAVYSGNPARCVKSE